MKHVLRFGKGIGVLLALAALMALGLMGCRKNTSETTKPGSSRKLRVTTTTTMVSDLVKQVGGDRVEVQGLMGAGVDPHLYKASANDVTKLQSAEVIFYSGLMLEGKMEEIFSGMAKGGKRVYAVTEGIAKEKLLHPTTFGGHPDPHVWFEVPLWAECVDTVVKGLSDARPADKEYFAERGAAAKKAMAELHQWALKRAEELPKEKRVLITSHDAFSYFGRAYGFQVVGLQGISTVVEAGGADMAKLVDFIKKNNVRAIFIESSVSPNTIKRISEDAGVKIGGELFSDAMGTPGQIENGYDLGTYEGMIKHNLDTVVNALK
jgi:manganese/zinc/iron transport system substrate-binding protein